MMDNGGLSVADALALSRNSNCCNDGNNGMWGGDGFWVIFLFFLLACGGWNNNGWGGNAGTGGSGFQGWATRADINDGFALNNIQSGINGITQGICDSTYALNNAITNGFSNMQLALMQGLNGVNSQLSSLGYQMQDCCCQTQRAIDGVNYNMSQSFCNLQNAMNNNVRDIIDNQNAGTQAIMSYLQQKENADLRAENQSLRFQASQSEQNAFITANQSAQTAELIRRLGADCPVPAYVVPNPNCCYGNPIGVGYGYSGYSYNGCGCGNNNGCC